jgi:lysyl-tRNA synthetase, class I
VRAFLDTFGFDYEFVSATERYKAGAFDATLLRRCSPRYDEIMAIMLPTLGEERRATYSHVPAGLRQDRTRACKCPSVERKAAKGIDRVATRTPARWSKPRSQGGAVKLQWKADWALRWAALGVRLRNVGQGPHRQRSSTSSKIVRALGGKPPEGFTYELFLDENGEKISKSKRQRVDDRGVADLRPARKLCRCSCTSEPKAAKRLLLRRDPAPRRRLLLSFVERYPGQPVQQRLDNPAYHIHTGAPPAPEANALPFNILLNLAAVANTEDKTVLWGFISRYSPQANPAANPMLDRLVGHAIAYFRDKVKPTRKYRAPSEGEKRALADLDAMLAALPAGADGAEIQNRIYEIGKRPDFADLKAWFQCLYETLLGSSQGPRMGSFVALYGVAETRALIAKALSGELSK